jgi:hypothetical protein
MFHFLNLIIMNDIIRNHAMACRFFNEVVCYGMNEEGKKGKALLAQTIFRANKEGGYARTNQKTGNRFCFLTEDNFLSVIRELDDLTPSIDGLTLYVSAVPVDMAAAGRLFLSDMVAATLPLVGNKEQYDQLMVGMSRKYFSALEKCPMKKKLIHFNVNVANGAPEASAHWLKESLDASGAYNRVVTTRGGFHVFAEPQAMAYASSVFGIKNREDAMSTLIDEALGGVTTECQPCSSIMCPLPGTAQRSADFIVGIL